MTQRVWITNYAGHDYTAASAYGELAYITKGYVSFQSLDRLKYTITESVTQTHEEDWLLPSGRPLISIITALAWLAKHGKVKILHWDQKAGGKYHEVVITLANLQEILTVLKNGEHPKDDHTL